MVIDSEANEAIQKQHEAQRSLRDGIEQKIHQASDVRSKLSTTMAIDVTSSWLFIGETQNF